MISQETKDIIEKEALVEFPERLIGTHTGSIYDQNEHDRAIWKEGATKYAEKFEETEKGLREINTHLGIQPSNGWALSVNQIQHFKEIIESKDHELAQLNEITKGMVKCIQAIEQDGFVGNGSEVAMNEALTAYTEWCKQNLK